MNDKWKAFFKEKGFYISLAVGAAAILLIGIISANLSPKSDVEPEQMVKEETEALPQTEVAKTTPPPSVTKEPSKAPQTTPQTKPVEKTSTKTGEDTNIGSKTQGSDATQTYTNTEQTEPKVAPVISQSDRIANLSFDEEKGLLWPIEGEVLLPYSMDQSIYFDTLAQYKVNPALIIAGAQGMDVLCAYNGVITSIDENEETGITVTMSIGDSYEIVYGNLENVTFEEGDYVAEKTCLGTLAAPSKYYIKEGCNLFFEVLQKDETVDPLLLLR